MMFDVLLTDDDFVEANEDDFDFVKHFKEYLIFKECSFNGVGRLLDIVGRLAYCSQIIIGFTLKLIQ